MASSNRHWPSMFKSKPCNHQWHHDHLMSSGNCHRTPYSSGSGCEERTPEPKPRWNPRPEQIRILECIFNSGMVNPPRDEIRKIRVQLQEYGQVGDANVFYWFQNRKSRSKHKQRQLQNAKSHPQQTTPPPQPPAPAPAPPSVVTAASSSSSSSNKSSPNNSNEKQVSINPSAAIDLLNSPSPSVNQHHTLLQPSADFLAEPFLFTNTGVGSGPGFWFSDGPNFADQSFDNCSNFLLNELMLMNQFPTRKNDEEYEKMKLQQNQGFAVPNAAHMAVPPSVPVPNLSNQTLHGVSLLPEQPSTKSMVFINDVCFELAAAPFNIREAFGDDAVLVQASGQPVLTNEWGETLEPLQHGGFYYLLPPFSPPPPDRAAAIDLV